MIVLSKIISKKSFIVSKDATIDDALSIMHNNKNGAAIFVENNIPIAIITESNIVNALKNNITFEQKAIDFATKPVITAHHQRPLEYAFEQINEFNIRRIILVDESKKYVGVVLQEELFNYLEEDVYKIDLKIFHLIKEPQILITIDESETIQKALEMMQVHSIGSIIVLENGNAVGIVTEKDILNFTYKKIELSHTLKEYISKPLITIEHDLPVIDAIKLMKNKNIRRLIIKKDSVVIAILTNRDIIKQLKGNYNRILQSKVNHAKEIMNYLPESIIEIYSSSEQNIIHWMNKKALKEFGEIYIDLAITNLFSQNLWDEILLDLRTEKAIENKQIKIDEKSFEISGSKNGNYTKLILKDISKHENEKKLLQKEVYKEMHKRLENEYLLMQQSKLATMGEMIGHIAHQWRQPLSQLGGIFMNLHALCEFDDLKPDEVKEKVNRGNKLLKYMSATIEDFRHFFQPNQNKQKFELQPYIQNAINLIDASLSYYNIEIELQDFESTYIDGFASEFSQVILNILNNAKDALVLNKIKNPKILISCKRESENIIILIEDNAGGIDPYIIENIFDLYFTTKKNIQGSGLGLYMTRLILSTKMDGTIDVSNGKNGAIFSIKLKIAQK